MPSSENSANSFLCKPASSCSHPIKPARQTPTHLDALAVREGWQGLPVAIKRQLVVRDDGIGILHIVLLKGNNHASHVSASRIRTSSWLVACRCLSTHPQGAKATSWVQPLSPACLPSPRAGRPPPPAAAGSSPASRPPVGPAARAPWCLGCGLQNKQSAQGAARERRRQRRRHLARRMSPCGCHKSFRCRISVLSRGCKPPQAPASSWALATRTNPAPHWPQIREMGTYGVRESGKAAEAVLSAAPGDGHALLASLSRYVDRHHCPQSPQLNPHQLAQYHTGRYK